MLAHFLILLASVIFTSSSPCHATSLNSELTKMQSVVSHIKVGISNVKLAKASLRLPQFIPLLHGNSIENYRKIGVHYTIFHSPTLKTKIFPLKRRPRKGRHMTGFIFKQSTSGLFPVPMENTMVVASLRHSTASSSWLHLWIMSRGKYSKVQLNRQRLFSKSLVQEYADNARRVLGVAHCPKKIQVSGLCNHLSNTMSGTSLQPLWSPIKHERPDTPAMLAMEPNVRLVSDKMAKVTKRKEAPFHANMFLVSFGQFLDHDIVLTPGDHSLTKEAIAPIQDLTNGFIMNFRRSSSLHYSYAQCCTTPYTKKNLWKGQPFNRVTSFIDGSGIYGANHLRANTLRSFKNGKLILKQFSRQMFLPFNHPSHIKFKLHNEPSDEKRDLFVAGDVRANENIFLTAIHTLFAREHNRVCHLLMEHLKLSRSKKLLRDGWLFQTARKIVTAELQSITYNEFVPMLLGKDALPPYKGYNPSIDARISTFHSAFAFRWGHSAIWESYRLRDRMGKVRAHQLKDMFFNSEMFLGSGVDNILETMIKTPASDVDEEIIDSLRDSLFNPPAKHVLDLASLNMQRLRDLGIPHYLKAQAVYRTGRSLSNIEPRLRQKLVETYKNVNNIDAFIGGLCEKKKEGALLGPLFWEINRDQFLRMRDGDRFHYRGMKWHRKVRTMPLVKSIRSDKWTFADLVVANSKWRASQFKKGESVFRTTSPA